MVSSNNLSPGTMISINNKLYRVESSVKVTVPKGAPFIKTKLRDLAKNKVTEKNFKLNQTLKEVSSEEESLEFLYLEGKNYLFLNISNLDQVLIPAKIIGDKLNYLKEGVEVKASFYGDTAFAIELPQFLELMVSKTEPADEEATLTNVEKIALLETGAKLKVPSFIEIGDIIKVDTERSEYIQRV